MTIRAIYANGVFKPFQPLMLPEGAQVDLVYSTNLEHQSARVLTQAEKEYEQRIKAAKTIDELIAVQATAPPLPEGYDLCEALNANRRATGERLLYPERDSGEAS